jgi:acyl-CoA reductase-like NAD-dependent aldehyde dehydrogenase
MCFALARSPPLFTGKKNKELISYARNAPYILGTRAIAFPVAAGNTAILKGSELSPHVMWGIVSVFEEAGLPPGVLNFITHTPKDAAVITEHLIAHPHIKKINFTGSTTVGRIIGELAGKYIKPVLLELGGKAPAIIWEDADLETAVTQCALGSFLNSGQICMSTERIILHGKIRSDFEKKLKEKLQQLFDPEADAPVLIQAASVEKNAKLVRDALSKGAELLHGDLADLQGTRMRPLVLSGVSKDADIYRTESFGTSVSIYTIETEAEAIQLANDTEYGLSAAVFTKDLGRGLRIAKSIESGAVHINSMTVHDESALPHGGVKASGFGRFNGKAIEEWVKMKTVTFQIDSS